MAAVSSSAAAATATSAATGAASPIPSPSSSSSPSSAPRLRIGNVPEHFSSPLHIGASRGIFQSHDVEVQLVNCPGGTGEMVKGLECNDLDVAIALTEGLVSAIAKGSSAFTIIGTYVDAPLTWAISAGSSSAHSSVESLRGGTIGISRLGSGSHIMSYVLAEQKGWLHTGDEVFKFNILRDFKGLRDGVNTSTADAFMWEEFTTKPYHDSREVKRIGQITTPWPAFLIAVRTELLEQHSDLVRRLLLGISEASEIFMKERETGVSIDYVSRTYNQKVEDVQAWFKTVRYPKDCSQVSEKVLRHCVQTLIKAQVLNEETEPEKLADRRVACLF